MPAKFLPAHDQILRDVYPMFGSRGVINILPQFKTKQVNMRAYTLGVKMDPGWQKKVALANQTGQEPGDTQAPDRPDSYDIYSNAAERLAYARRWV